MAAIPLVRANHVIPVVDFLKQIGSPTDRLLSQVNLSTLCLENPEGLIPLYPGSALIENAAQLEGIEALGILIGQQTPISALGAFGRMLRHSLTLFDLLMTLDQILGMADSGFQFRLCWERDWVNMQYHSMGLAHTANLQTQYYSTMMCINALRLALGKTWRPSEISLEGPPCRALLALDEFSGVQIHFLSPQNIIKIPRSALALPVNPTAAVDDLTGHPDYEIFSQSAPAQDFAGSLRQTIGALLPLGYPDINLVADVVGLSKRKLQRQLAAAGSPYSRLVEEARFKQAIALLNQPEIKLLEIAAELGYTDAANFTRAFKRWTGVSPREYRLSQG